MKDLALELTNRCNRACLHCFRNRADSRQDLPLEIAEHILEQARDLGVHRVCLTGGEIALYPYLEELLRKIANLGFAFSLISNGHLFRDYVLPALREEKVKARPLAVCFSLDGASETAHDALRGPGSFAEVGEAVAYCRKNQIPFSLKTVVTKFNRKELTKLARLGELWGAKKHEFLLPTPTATLVRKGLLPPPEEFKKVAHWMKTSLGKAVNTKVEVVGYLKYPILNCSIIMEFLNVDFQGNLILCCQLSHVAMGDGVPTRFNGELVADLTKVSLKEGIIRQYRMAAKLMEDKLRSTGNPAGISQNPCNWCLYHFGKLEWLKEFPDSPWAKEMLPN